MSIDGGRPTRFTDAPGKDFHPVWSPDGSQLAYISERAGFQHVWIAPVNNGIRNGEPFQLTFGESADLFPTWLPDGNHIAYISARGGDPEVWIVATSPTKEAYQLTHGAQASRAVWDNRSDQLLVSGRWNEGKFSLQNVSLESGVSIPFEHPVDFGNAAEFGQFSISGDGRFVAWCQTIAAGDVWIAHIESGTL